MALKTLQSGVQPLGQFDGYDTQYTLFKGGEVCSLMTIVMSTDVAAADIADGYSGTSLKVRPAVTFSLVSGMRPLFLADEGVAGYGTLFGSVVGAITGRVVSGGAVLGPATSAASGKVTCWDKPGLYAVTLDAADTTALTGLVPANTALTPGDALYATASGLITPSTVTRFENVVIGRFVEFSSNGSLVTTPASLIGNQPNSFTECVFHFFPEL